MNHPTPKGSQPPGKRNRYFKHKYVTANDFRLEQSYGIQRRHLINRTALGWGVVAGFELQHGEPLPEGHLLSGPGLALDQHGRELHLAQERLLAGADFLLLEGLVELARHAREELNSDQRAKLRRPCLLQAHYAEQGVDKVRFGDNCDCGDDEWNHVQETVVFSLIPLPKEGGVDLNRCPGCACCDGDNHGDNHGDNPGRKPEREARAHDRGPHACLCEWVEHRPLPPQHAELCNWRGTLVALHDPVPLGLVTIGFDSCGNALIVSLDNDCAPRKLVKNNDLLFDLIRGCDLTHIAAISWGDWHRRREPVPWPEFVRWFPRPLEESDADQTLQSGQGRGHKFDQVQAGKIDYVPHRGKPGHDAWCHDWKKHPPVATKFQVEFSGPVRVETLSEDVITFTIHVPDERSGWLEPVRVPILRLAPDAPREGDPEGSTRRVTIEVSGDWADDEIWDRNTLVRHARARAEIEIRGDYIIDCKGQALDANAVGLRPAPSGNGSPGGNYLSVFHIVPGELSKA